MTTKVNDRVWTVAFMLAMLIGATGYARGESVECNICSSVANSELESIRGGYLAGDGLEITFGIERAVFINGVLQAMSTLNVPLLGSESGQAVSDNLLSNMMIVRQNGDGNNIAMTGGQSGLFTFIQNSLDFTAIKNVTQINASINVLDTYRNMNLRSLINEQLINAMK